MGFLERALKRRLAVYFKCEWFLLLFRRLCKCRLDPRRADLDQASGVSEAAHPVETRRAFEVDLMLDPQHFCPSAERRRVLRACRAEHRDLRHTERGGDMHQ